MQAMARPLVYPRKPMFLADDNGTITRTVTTMTSMSPFKYHAL